MDTSREYFEMCDKATEIKENHNVVSGDYFNGGEICEEIYECNNDEGYLIKSIYGKWFLPSECVWLPRQDQLQKMIIEKYGFVELQEKFVWFIGWVFDYIDNRSYEMCWLAFVMYGKFNKIWDGKKWTKK